MKRHVLAPFKTIGFTLLATLIGASVVSAAPQAPEVPRGVDLYAAIGRDAAAGDASAGDLKATIDAYLARHKLRVEDLGDPKRSASTASMGTAQLRLEGSPPWSVRVVNDTDLESLAKLDAYRVDRHGQLAALAAANPTRMIRVVVAPNDLFDVSDFLSTLDCACTGMSIVVDVFSSTGWLMSSGRDLDGGNVADSAAQLEKDLLELASMSMDQFAEADRQGIHATIRRIEVEVPARQALALAGRPNVLMVDTLTDIADAYRDVAALVKVDRGPDAFGAYAALKLGNPIVPGPNPVKVQ